MDAFLEVKYSDIVDAYRKVKADLFYANPPRCLDVLEFERNLCVNLLNIKKAFDSYDRDFFNSLCSGFSLEPKKALCNDDNSANVPRENKVVDTRLPENVDRLEFRLFEQTPIAFHIVMELWIFAVGEKLEKRLSSSAYGNRIRRTFSEKEEICRSTIGTFPRYYYKYRDWRNNGLHAIERELKKGNNVVALTSDFSSFYHMISPRFLLDTKMLALLNVELTPCEEAFTELIVRMLERWALSTPLERGLPVGCAVSCVISNLALFELDAQMDALNPSYYGRYVDDLLLVFNTENSQITDHVDAWAEILRKVRCLEKSEGGPEYHPSYNVCSHENEYLRLGSEKTKVFFLTPRTGRMVVDEIRKHIAEKGSAIKLMPELPDPDSPIPSLRELRSHKGECVDNLRKVDDISLRRTEFSVAIREMECYCRNLDPKDWSSYRLRFFQDLNSMVLSPLSYVDLYRYFPRLFAIAALCSQEQSKEERKEVRLLWKKLDEYASLSFCDKKISIAAGTTEPSLDQIQDWSSVFRNAFHARVKEAVLCAANMQRDVDDTWLWAMFGEVRYIDAKERTRVRNELLQRDLAFQSVKEIMLEDLLSGTRCSSSFREKPMVVKTIAADPSGSVFELNDCLRELLSGCDLAPLSTDKLPGLLFPTRPLDLTEALFLFNYETLENEGRDTFWRCLRRLNGYFNAGPDAPLEVRRTRSSERFGASLRVLSVPNNNPGKTIRVALANWKTDEKSLNAVLDGKRDSCRSDRFKRLNRLINDVLRSDAIKHINYLVFPELSIPAKWFIDIARRLDKNNISLIGGVDYILSGSASKREVSNEVWCNLTRMVKYFNKGVLIRFRKEIPALEERQNLAQRPGLRYSRKKMPQTICWHGDIAFSVLICSELTNIKKRSNLRGMIDLLFVPEWNQDIKTFNALVESTALDIHAYIVQCNNRVYGDTRIRHPAKTEYERDILKLKGGDEDGFMVGSIDVEKLRQFQRKPIPNNIPKKKKPEHGFKPLPEGFRMHPIRQRSSPH